MVGKILIPVVMLDVRTTSLTKKYFYVINRYEFAINSLYYETAECRMR